MKNLEIKEKNELFKLRVKAIKFYTLARDEVDIKYFEKAVFKITHVSFIRDRLNSKTVSINP